MAVNISKVEKLTGSSGPISFSQIKDEFGGNTTNIRASLYRRNDGDNVDWDGPDASKIEPKIPDATENQDIGSKNNWNVSALRNTVMEYNVTQSGSSEELAYFDSDTSTWNGNLNRNVLKKFDVTGTIFANQINKDALTFGGDLYNLEIEVDATGKIYGEGGQLNVSLKNVSGTSNVVNEQTNVIFGPISGIGLNVTRFSDEDLVFTDRQPVPEISGSANVEDVKGDVKVTDNVNGASFSVERYINDDQIDPNSGPKDAINAKSNVSDVQGKVESDPIEGAEVTVTRFNNVPSSNPSEPIPAVNGTAEVTDYKGTISIPSQITGASAKITRWFEGDTNTTNQKEGSDTITVTNNTSSISVESNNLGATVKVSRDTGGATSSEGNAVGTLKYYVDVTGVIDPVVTGSTNTTKRASYANTGLTYPAGTIAMSSGYPKKVSDTRWEFAFDMPNSQGFGRQATFAYNFDIEIDLPAVVGGSEGQAVGSMGYYIDFDSELNNPSVSAAVVNTSTRASDPNTSGANGTIKLVSLRKINSTRYEVTFDMANSITSGRQGTYVRSWSYTVTSDAVAGGTEGHPVGSLVYYIDISGGSSNPVVTASISDTNSRASGLDAGDNSIRLVSGYPKAISDTRSEVAFDMTNSLASGERQATYAKFWSFSVSTQVQTTSASIPVGGDALYVNNTRTNSPVEIYSYGRIYAGGGGGASGNPGNSGSSLSCSSTTNFTATNNQCRPETDCRNLSDAMPGQTCRRSRRGSRWISGTPVASSIRSRCRGDGTRRSEAKDGHDGGNYVCYRTYSVTCQQTNTYSLGGGIGGNAGNGGRGRGFSYQSGSLSGNSGNSGNSNSCSGGTSTGNSGNSGTSGGDWGQSGGSGAPAGIAIQKKNAVMKSYTSNTVKGSIVDI